MAIKTYTAVDVVLKHIEQNNLIRFETEEGRNNFVQDLYSKLEIASREEKEAKPAKTTQQKRRFFLVDDPEGNLAGKFIEGWLFESVSPTDSHVTNTGKPWDSEEQVSLGNVPFKFQKAWQNYFDIKGIKYKSLTEFVHYASGSFLKEVGLNRVHKERAIVYPLYMP